MIPDQLHLPMLDKRWAKGEQRFALPPNVFDPKPLRVEPIPTRDARAFCQREHYSRSMPAARFCVGIFERTNLVGVGVFSVPMHPDVIRKWVGVEPHEGVELGRLVLLDIPALGFNAESWFLKRAFRLLREYDRALKGVVSFADPMERRDRLTDSIVKQAHWGVCYRASNARFCGRTGARRLHLAPNGTVLSPRTLSKLRNDERGRDYAERQLLAAGVEPRAPHEASRAYLDRVLPTLDSIRHPGNLAFTFSL